ncbi:hypothetical protein rpr22_CDSx368 [Rickettsia prowazekii str. Rp22]|uniref:Uncharacterized protein n=1 Tax=Rickettsia prowazekii (strain Rp22) TaxID=449216 RepID=D5AWS8_RICPP|nr:hypothetical protein rpr22_CDSx368 [Rickettsia prowazekii str. Rp22]
MQNSYVAFLIVFLKSFNYCVCKIGNLISIKSFDTICSRGA